MDTRTLALLARYLPTFLPTVEAGKGEDIRWERLDLPLAEGADYSWVLYEYSNGDKHIYAKRKGATSDEYFWYLPIELAGFGNDKEEVTKEYLEILENVLAHATRITQKRGLLLRTFKCQYLNHDNRWKTISTNSTSRFSAELPPYSERTRMYESPMLSKVS
ncbi:MAG TPA: hypothetical protein VM009_04305 [Terriglobales bacterium]|nr:hypothetical protein [Terriglobales bacterium]